MGAVETRRTLTPDDPTSPGSVVTIGAYDGVHRGHRQIITEVCRIAGERGLRSAVVTFDRHPASVVRPESAPLLLTDLDQKLEQLSTTGVDTTVVVPFDDARALETAEDFVTEVLIDCLGVKVVVVGEDFHKEDEAILKEHDIDIAGFRHVVEYDPALGRMSLYLESRRDQQVQIAGRPFRLTVGERIHTEDSWKYTLAGFRDLANRAGFEHLRSWTDDRLRFSLHYLRGRL